ncbi:30s ribosomal protein s8, partial [Quercus suber]
VLREGLIENVKKHQENNKYFLVLTLRCRRNRKGPCKTILNLKQISRLGLRIYSSYQRIPRILGGMGIVILSTRIGPNLLSSCCSLVLFPKHRVRHLFINKIKYFDSMTNFSEKHGHACKRGALPTELCLSR